MQIFTTYHLLTLFYAIYALLWREGPATKQTVAVSAPGTHCSITVGTNGIMADVWGHYSHSQADAMIVIA